MIISVYPYQKRTREVGFNLTCLNVIRGISRFQITIEPIYSTNSTVIFKTLLNRNFIIKKNNFLEMF